MFKWLNDSVCALNDYLRRFEDYLSGIFDDYGDDYYYEPEDIDDEEDEYDDDDVFYF